jgi:ATP-dependent RNA helicase RhlE
VRKSCRVLVLGPTRELSRQILDSFRTYARYLRFGAALAIGGVSMSVQVRALLNGVDILVATPGRLLDLVKSNALRLGEVDASFSTKPIGCSTWALSMTSVRLLLSFRSSGRR